MAIHSSILAWKIPWMEEPRRLQSMGWQRVRHDWATSFSLSKRKRTHRPMVAKVEGGVGEGRIGSLGLTNANCCYHIGWINNKILLYSTGNYNQHPITSYKWNLSNLTNVFKDPTSFCQEFDFAAAKSLQSCLTPCDPINGSPPGSPIPGILQSRTLEWVPIAFSSGSSQPRYQTQISHIAGRRFYHLSHQGNPLIKILPTDIQIRCALDYFPWRESYNFNKKKCFNSQPVLYKYDIITCTSKTCS